VTARYCDGGAGHIVTARLDYIIAKPRQGRSCL